ncbi:MAG: RagB/SusD family nutrient uptake outer membrane protein [Chitinophagaceae bacterium]|nr:RagB/SusD family nutrient uptake outer membrane protein [Chitinophagaceae bacterium]
MHVEALVLRAQYLFELIRNWGDVPVSFEPAYKTIGFIYPQAEPGILYDRLLNDLKTAIEFFAMEN